MAHLTRSRRLLRLVIALVVLAAVVYVLVDLYFGPPRSRWRPFPYKTNPFNWAHRPEKFPVLESSLVSLPSGEVRPLRTIQHDFSADWADKSHARVQLHRRDAVRNSFKKCWESYREYAWDYDELTPTTLLGVDTYSGWGSTRVDALDTLWIMGLHTEFREAVQAVAAVDWDSSTSRSCSLFETNIRYLGGLLATYEMSGEKVLLDKALDLANMLYAAFDTPNRMPANDFNFRLAKSGGLTPSEREPAASVGTLSLEFVKLTQLTGQQKFYDAVDKIKWEMWRTQDGTGLPGMWPTYIDLKHEFGTNDNTFTLGSMADSLYEYLPKTYALLGGLDPAYEDMYKKAMDTAVKHLLYRPMLPQNEDILFSGSVVVKGEDTIELTAESQHLACFTGGMFALGGKLFDIQEHIDIGDKLARGCAWAYAAFPTGVMPEISELVPCDTPDLGPCPWNRTRWESSKSKKDGNLPPGFTAMHSSRYLLRPEAIESLFILYRITGNRDLLDMAWTMFQAIKKSTETPFAFSAISDVNTRGPTDKMDSMESFWFAETLKYFYLIFSEPGYFSLDDYVFNTEAHPLKIMKPH